MTTNNQIPVSDTATMPQVSKPTNSFTSEDVKEFMSACAGQPAPLDLDEMDMLDKWLDKSKASRRVALAMLSKPYDELESQILNDRNLAVAIADAYVSSDGVERGLEFMTRLVRQSRLWMVTALTVRPDCEEILAEFLNDEGNTDAEPPAN